MNPQRLIYLYSDSVFTPWKENIFSDTIINLLKSTPEGYYPFVTHFVGFTNEFASFLKQFDLVFNVCYGYHDSGQADVAQWLDSHDIKHTASSYDIQILAKDKVNLPMICKAINAKTPEILTLSEIPKSNFSRFIAKPRMGSLHLNMLIFEKDNIPYQELLERDDYIFQPYLTGREFTVGVVPNEECTDYVALEPLEIKPNDNREIYIAGQNYGTTEKVLNPNLDITLKNELKEVVLNLHKTMKIRGMSRTDVRVHDGQIYVLDINTMPNLDSRSFLPLIAQNEGIDFKELLKRVLNITKLHYKHLPLTVAS